DLFEMPDAETCCGFGSTFAVKNADVSRAMLADKMRNMLATRAEACAAGDSSCLMHIGCGLSRLNPGTRTAHLADILAGTQWEELREAGRAIKARTMAGLDGYLEQLEAEFTARGGTVHWARDAIEANQIVTGLVQATGATEVVKVKSIVTDEIGLNDALADGG